MLVGLEQGLETFVKKKKPGWGVVARKKRIPIKRIRISPEERRITAIKQATAAKEAYIKKHGLKAWEIYWKTTPGYKAAVKMDTEIRRKEEMALAKAISMKKRIEKRRKKRKKLHKVIKGVAIGLAAAPFAIALAPVVGPAISGSAKMVGGGLAKVKTLIASGSKVLGTTALKTGVGLVKTAATGVILEQASGLLAKVPLSPAEEEVVETIKEQEIEPAISQGIDLYEIERALKQDIFPSEIIQAATEKHIPVKDAFLPEQIREIKQEKKKKQLNDIIPLVLGGGSFIASLI